VGVFVQQVYPLPDEHTESDQRRLDPVVPKRLAGGV
jgi:hypothetical protein